jgi:hypothetical protein
MNVLKITLAATAAFGIAVSLLATIATLLAALGHLPSTAVWERVAALLAVLPLLFVSTAGLAVAATRHRGWRIAGAVAWGLLVLRWTQLAAPWTALALVEVRGLRLDLSAVLAGTELGVATVFLATLVEAAGLIGAGAAIRSVPGRAARLARSARHTGRPHLPSARPL